MWGHMWSSGRGSGSRSDDGSDPERERRFRLDATRKRGARRWTNRGMSLPASFRRSETEEYDRRRASFSSARCSYAGNSSSVKPQTRFADQVFAGSARVALRQGSNAGFSSGYFWKTRSSPMAIWPNTVSRTTKPATSAIS
ncbi:CDPK-related protein kinase [Hordeum vulgare]|nr:CDPK-related protein kinase [Hordeum vulgare]